MPHASLTNIVDAKSPKMLQKKHLKNQIKHLGAHYIEQSITKPNKNTSFI